MTKDELTELLEKASAEILKLKAENAKLRKELGDLPEAQAEMLSTIKQLRKELAELRKEVDAEPVAWRVWESGSRYVLYFNKHSADRAGEVQTPRTFPEPLYTHPPRAQPKAEPVQEPYCILYEWDGPFGLHQETSHRQYNGKYPDRSVKLYTAPQAKADCGCADQTDCTGACCNDDGLRKELNQ